jgi:hypothetical protein
MVLEKNIKCGVMLCEIGNKFPDRVYEFDFVNTAYNIVLKII